MPYIKPADRVWFDNALRYIIDLLVTSENSLSTPGELNYVISSICAGILSKCGTSYTLLNEMIGVLECCKLELYRRVAVPYEDKKIEENGDVFETQ